MAKVREHERALILRRRGKSIAEIARSLQVSKSTVSFWCRDIALTPIMIQVLTDRNRSKGIESFLIQAEEKRKRRLQNIAEASHKGASRIDTLSPKDIFCIGLGLYWGEGYKHGNQEFGFTNSDPDMIRFYLVWLREVFNIQQDDLILRISINEIHAHRIREVEKFWSHITKVPLVQFTKISLIKSHSQKIYTNQSNHWGTLRIKVRGGTEYRREILGSIQEIARQYAI